jgi:hypothetical protein
VIREELEPCRLDVRFQTVQLDTVPVVDENIFLLRDRKVRVIVQKPLVQHSARAGDGIINDKRT